ncbi:MAG TPA: hypothetical protein VE954_20770 [Oligoflexus sp.]|uniref:hypothetical protein n=1 Tax=Oligoflexus sp. TaxID=1971216 RepID=UPI002D411A74|nr:hypothetical protein [Oligoflexus sp.]HYX35537.1 hypothetical protein [Oligoflexus sp.]
MNRMLCLAAMFLLLSCKGGKNGSDDRQFGSLSASFGSKTYGQGSEDAVVIPDEDTIVIDKNIDGGVIDAIGKGGPKPEENPGPGKETPPPAKGPELPDALKVKLAKCWPQWDKGAAGEKYDIRQVTLDVEKLKKSTIQLTGDKPEVVFVSITSASYIEKVSLALENAKGLYCLDITAEKGIEYLDIAYVCGAKLGLVDIEGGKAKKVNIREVCNKP